MKKQILTFAINCSDYISISEAYALPYKEREMIIKLIGELNKKLSK